MPWHEPRLSGASGEPTVREDRKIEPGQRIFTRGVRPRRRREVHDPTEVNIDNRADARPEPGQLPWLQPQAQPYRSQDNISSAR
jgi:hypothetical protein